MKTQGLLEEEVEPEGEPEEDPEADPEVQEEVVGLKWIENLTEMNPIEQIYSKNSKDATEHYMILYKTLRRGRTYKRKYHQN